METENKFTPSELDTIENTFKDVNFLLDALLSKQKSQELELYKKHINDAKTPDEKVLMINTVCSIILPSVFQTMPNFYPIFCYTWYLDEYLIARMNDILSPNIYSPVFHLTIKRYLQDIIEHARKRWEQTDDYDDVTAYLTKTFEYEKWYYYTFLADVSNTTLTATYDFDIISSDQRIQQKKDKQMEPKFTYTVNFDVKTNADKDLTAEGIKH